MLLFTNHDLPIDDDVFDPPAELMGIGPVGEIDDVIEVEDNDIGKESFPDLSPAP